MCIRDRDKTVLLSSGYAHPVVRPCHRSEIYHKQQIALSVLRVADEAEYTPVPVIGIHPLEPIRGIIRLVQGRCLPI